jgi:hypothetical protein
MTDTGPEFSFLGLPLTAEQESEIQHYIHQRMRRGLPCDREELRAMLADMLEPPIKDGDTADVDADSVQADAERAAALADDSNDPIAASEERTAAREAEAMKHPEH